MPPRTERKRVDLRVEDHVGPTTPIAPFQRQPLIKLPSKSDKRLLIDALRKEFETNDDASEIAATLKALCLEGNLDAIKFVFLTLEGKPVSASASVRITSTLGEIAEHMTPEAAQQILAAASRFAGAEPIDIDDDDVRILDAYSDDDTDDRKDEEEDDTV